MQCALPPYQPVGDTSAGPIPVDRQAVHVRGPQRRLNRHTKALLLLTMMKMLCSHLTTYIPFILSSLVA